MSVILNFASGGAAIAGSSPYASFVVISAKTQFLDQVKINSTLQLISGMFKLLQKLLKYFRGKQVLHSLINHYLLVFFL